MKRLFKIFLFLVFSFCVIASFSQFQKTALSKIHWSEWKWFDHESKDLSVSFRVYSKSECKELLSKDLVSKGYQPIQIDIVNPTSHEYEINPADVSLPSEKPTKMAFKVMKSAIPRSIILKIAGLFFWPVNIVGAIDSLNSMIDFDDMKTGWQAMSIQPNEKVPPYSTLHRVIFVPEDHLKDAFTIQLKDIKTGEYEIFESVASLNHLVQMQNDEIKIEGSSQTLPTPEEVGDIHPGANSAVNPSEDAQIKADLEQNAPSELSQTPDPVVSPDVSEGN